MVPWIETARGNMFLSFTQSIVFFDQYFEMDSLEAIMNFCIMIDVQFYDQNEDILDTEENTNLNYSNLKPQFKKKHAANFLQGYVDTQFQLNRIKKFDEA